MGPYWRQLLNVIIITHSNTRENRTMNTKEATRTRKHGTRVTAPKTGEERIAAIRQIVERHQYAKVDGVMIDAFSASAIVAIYDAISDKHKATYREKPAPVMADMAFQLLNKQKG